MNGSSGHQCDHCYDNDPNNQDCPTEGTSNNYMDYWPRGYDSKDPGLSECQLSRVRYFLMGEEGTINRTVLKDYCTYDSNKTIEINGTSVWNSHKRLGGDLIINSGSTLTIKCIVHIPEGGKVIIKPGGKLIIDEGVLTNECGDFWKGVEVWGTTAEGQFPQTNPTYQGILRLINGGTIENAQLGAANWHTDYWNEIGGVIKSSGGVFRNNKKDVAFMSYQNHTPSLNISDFSSFINTDFVSDDDFIEGLTQQPHVTLWQVHGIYFTNCHFSNDLTTDKSLSDSPNKGIYSINASFNIVPGCSTPYLPCPTSNLLRSSFTGLEYAVEASGAGASEAAVIAQTDFTDNIWGIKIDEFDNVNINRNYIELGDGGYGSTPSGIGVFLENSTGYIVEDNTALSLLPSGYFWGIIASNSGGDDNQIYKNTLENLFIGTFGNKINHNSNYQKGLQFLCNDYTNNETAISIGSSTQTDGVRLFQGDYSNNISKATGNTFVSNTKDIVNDANSIVYFYKGSNA